MSELKKATLQEIKSDEAGTPLGAEIEVQFNPSTLKLQINNTTEGGKSQGRQARQFIGASSTTLTLDLVFDTADEGTTDNPRNVREKTALVEKFVLPQSSGKEKQAPPKVRFHWGTLILDGIIDSVSIDFDLFAANGTPLRAKVGIAIKEQNSKYQFLKAGAGANKAGNVPAPGGASSGSVGFSAGFSAGISAGFSAGISGSVGFSAGFSAGISGSVGFSAGASASFGVAIGGESSAEFAARAGLDPAAWRGLSVGGNSSLSLAAGAEIGFSAGLTASAGIGVSIGVEAGVSASLEGSFGLEATAGVSAVAGVGVGAGLAAGFNLSAAGGVSAAVESVKIAKAQAAEQKARQAFNAPAATVSQLGATTTTTTAIARASTATGGAGAAPTRKPAMPEQQRAPLTSSGLPSATAQQAARPAPAPPRADPRSTSFGFGVPLRSAVGQAANLRAGALQGHVALRPQVSSGEPPSTTDPTTPPWVRLPVRNRASETADQKHKGAHSCGCAACRRRGGKRR